MTTTPSTPIFPLLSRTFKSRPYLPRTDNRKRKRSIHGTTSFEVRPSTNGVGMFATQKISCGDLIIENEDPIVHHCTTENHTKPNVCNSCAAPVGSLRENHLMAPHDITLPFLEDDRQGLVFTKSYVTRKKCEEEVAWCSDKCYRRGRFRHDILCGTSALRDFYDAQDNPIIFQLATHSILLVLSQLSSLSEREQTSIEEFYWWKDYGSHPLWWEVGSSRNAKKERATEFCRLLQNELLESAREERIALDGARVLQICTLENVSSILGMLQCNVMAYEYPSPTQQYIAHLEDVLPLVDEANDHDDGGEGGSQLDALKAGCKWLVNNVQGKLVEEDATNDGNKRHGATSGSGLYPLLTLANHDCNPNASIEFLQESNRGSMVATQDIEAGEEICITYVPNGGVGDRDDGNFFRHFEPTRTWKWLNSNDNDESSDESLSENKHSESSDDNEDDHSSTYSACLEESDGENEPSLEGSNQRDRALALLEYGFECQCRRCLQEQGKASH